MDLVIKAQNDCCDDGWPPVPMHRNLLPFVVFSSSVCCNELLTDLHLKERMLIVSTSKC